MLRRFGEFYATCASTMLMAAVAASGSHAADVIKANNTNALNLGTSWASGTAPTTADIGVWNSTVTAVNSSPLGGDVSWQGIKLQSPGGKVTITGAANTLTLGSAGINQLSGTQQLEIQSRVTLLTSQTWSLNAGQPGGADNHSVRFNAQSQPTSFTMGGNTLDLVGSGSVQFTSGSLLTGGTINVGNTRLDVQSGGSRTSAIGGDVAINVAAGKILRFGINSAPSGGLAVSSSAAIVLNSGTILIQSSGGAGTNRLVQSGPVSMNNGSGISNESTTGYATQFTGGIAVSGSTNWLESNTGTATTTFSGPLTGAGTLNVKNQATARWIEWSGDNSAFSGTVALNGASGNRNLRLTSGSAGSSLATWDVGGGNVLQLNGVTASLGTIAGTGTITNSSASAATASASSGTFAGILSNGTAGGTLGLTKTGAGVLALTGSNTYIGATAVNGGTLAVASSQTGGGVFTVADGATLGVSQASSAATFTTSALTLGSAGGSTLSLTPAASASAPVVTAAAFTVNGPTTLAVTANAASGLSLVDYTGSIGGSGFGGLSLALPFRVSGTLVDNVANKSVDLAGVQVNTPKWTGAINAVWNVNTTGSAGGGGTPNWAESASLTPTTYIQAGPGQTDSVIFDDTATGPTAIDLVAAVTPVSITVDNSTLAYSISGTGSIGGTTGIVKNGSQSLTLATANTFTGGITLNAGTLNLGNAGSIGSGKLTIAGGSLDNTSGASLTTTSAVAQDWNGDFTFIGTNDLTLGSGVVTLGGDRTVTVSAGALSVGGVGGSGRSLTKAGAGTLQIGASTYSGATTVSGGTLRAGSATSFTATSGVTLANVAGATLDLNGFSQTITNLTGGGTTGGNVALGGGTLTTGGTANATIGSLSGAGGLVKAGAGQFSILGGSAGFSGTTSITGGTLDVGPIAGTFGSGTISISGANFIQASGTLTQPVVGNAAGISARGGNLLVNVGGAGALIDMNSGGSGGLGQFNFGSSSADSRVVVSNTIGVNNNGGTRTITANAGTGTAEVEFAAPITPGTAGGVSGINKNGSGRVIYSAANTYTGTTTVNAGVLQISHRLALQNSVPVLSGTGTMELMVTDPVFGGLVGGTDLASMVTAGYGSVTSLTLNPGTGVSRTYSGVIANGAAGMSLTKSGSGIQTLQGANTYTGPTIISGGTLALSSAGTIDSTSVLSLAGGTFDVSAKSSAYGVAALDGSGGVNGPVAVNGLLSPGSPFGTITASSGFTLGSSGTYAYSLFDSGTLGFGSADLVTVGGDLTLTPGAQFQLSFTGTSTPGNRFTVFGYSGSLSGIFAGLPDQSLVSDGSGNQWQILYSDTTAGLNGGTGSLFVNLVAVPEPTSLVAALASMAVAMMALRRGRLSSE
jgi:autotransporter-associated beta strand protein